jgi:hypothetical protein
VGQSRSHPVVFGFVSHQSAVKALTARPVEDVRLSTFLEMRS